MAKKMLVTRREVFSSAHRLYNPSFTDDENEQIYDKCNNYHGHGHNYVLEVVVEGEIDEKTGYVIDLKVLKKIIIENVIRKVDHKHLNLDVDFMKDVIPTAENIAVKIWDQLVDKIPNGRLYKIKLSETENNYVEYFGA
ncbi:MAG: 6-carboxytetrahydropterin synthase [Ignavibacteriaceae bacterium]|jgi:6-pyruvoyltetrahydropterin/6-carboxytetrahydropterin synthase|nr:6-carboxytetrahydropterin synthase [Ignavibacteriales bacterium]MCC6636149.1 6-carboxytetrahydropterin synthase [Ignavibacteriaceae bacterium]